MSDDRITQMTRLRYMGEGMFEPTASAIGKLLDRQLVVGEAYRIDIYHERSEKFHAKYFAVIADAWEHLPEPWAAMLPSPEHLRKYALIKAGWCEVVTFPMKSREEALKAINTAKFFDAYCLATATGNVLTVYKARSQRKSYQSAAEFNETAEKVFQIIGEMIGVDPLTLSPDHSQ